MLNPPAEPQNLAEWLWYVRRYESGIFVRVRRDERWQSLSLAQLTPQEWGEQVGDMLERGVLPVRLLEPQERRDGSVG